MTKEEAIGYLKRADTTVGQKIKTRTAEALEMAIEALEQNSDDDAISRKFVKDEYRRRFMESLTDNARGIDLTKYVDIHCEEFNEFIDSIPPVNLQPKIRWIPVSERFPGKTDYYLVTVVINEDGRGMTRSVKMALYNAETKDFTVYTGTNMCVVEDVIAWCNYLLEFNSRRHNE